MVKLCRYKFPRYPLDKLEILYPVEKDDKNINNYKKDMLHIKKYLTRQCNDEASLRKIQEKNFWEFLYDLGFFGKGEVS